MEARASTCEEPFPRAADGRSEGPPARAAAAYSRPSLAAPSLVGPEPFQPAATEVEALHG